MLIFLSAGSSYSTGCGLVVAFTYADNPVTPQGDVCWIHSHWQLPLTFTNFFWLCWHPWVSDVSKVQSYSVWLHSDYCSLCPGLWLISRSPLSMGRDGKASFQPPSLPLFQRYSPSAPWNISATNQKHHHISKHAACSGLALAACICQIHHVWSSRELPLLQWIPASDVKWTF